MAVDDNTAINEKEALTGLQRFIHPYTKLISLMNSVGTLWVFAIMFFILADIIARSGFNSPLRGVPELVAYSLAGAVFFAIGSFAAREPLRSSRDVHRAHGEKSARSPPASSTQYSVSQEPLFLR